METGLLYGSFDECLKAEADMRAEWFRIAEARPKQYQEYPISPEFTVKQMVTGTCIPRAESAVPQR